MLKGIGHRLTNIAVGTHQSYHPNLCILEVCIHQHFIDLKLVKKGFATFARQIRKFNHPKKQSGCE